MVSARKQWRQVASLVSGPMLKLILLKSSDYSWVLLDMGERMAIGGRAHSDQASAEVLMRVTQETLAAAGVASTEATVHDLDGFFRSVSPAGDRWKYQDIQAESETDLLLQLARTPERLRRILSRPATVDLGEILWPQAGL